VVEFLPMKKDIHPNYRKVLFKDITTDKNFIVASSVETTETINEDGVDYPLVKVEISSSSHPFYSGKERSGGTTGRIDKFNQKYKKK
jgi:large subunit ribosomal protein L31